MQPYLVTGRAIQLHSGHVILSQSQHNARAHLLEKLSVKSGKIYCQILHPVMFKRGETFLYDGEVNKTLASMLESKGQPARPKPAANARSKASGTQTSPAAKKKAEEEARKKAGESSQPKNSDESKADGKSDQPDSKGAGTDDAAASQNTQADLV